MTMPPRRSATVIALSTLLACAHAPDYDAILRGGLLYDGTGAGAVARATRDFSHTGIAKPLRRRRIPR
jgi:hypothetical protein